MTKEQLRRYGDLKLERDQLYRLLQEVESQMVTPKASKFTGLPVHHDISDDRFASCIYRRDVLRTRYAAKITELTCELDAIESAIQVLPSRERTLIRLHYIEGKTWSRLLSPCHIVGGRSTASTARRCKCCLVSLERG